MALKCTMNIMSTMIWYIHGTATEERPSILMTRNTIRSGRWKRSKRANGKKRPGSMISGEDAFWSGMPSETKALRNMKPTGHTQPCHYAEGGGGRLRLRYRRPQTVHQQYLRNGGAGLQFQELCHQPHRRGRLHHPQIL